MKNILVCGFGRMGISHSVLASSLLSEDVCWYICEKSLFMKLICNVILNSKVKYISYNQIQNLPYKYFDYTFVTTPPSNRSFEINTLSRFSKKVYCEKPLLCSSLPRNVFPGYVYINSPTILFLKNELLNNKSLTSGEINVSIQSNIDYDQSISNWRNSKFGSLSYEFIGHAISIALSPIFKFVRDNNFEFTSSSISPNLCVFEFNTNNFSFTINLFGKCNVRKTVINAEYNLDEKIFELDQYSVSSGGEEIYNVASHGLNCPFYLRGYDFSLHMIRFLRHSNWEERDICNSIELLSKKLIHE